MDDGQRREEELVERKEQYWIDCLRVIFEIQEEGTPQEATSFIYDVAKDLDSEIRIATEKGNQKYASFLTKRKNGLDLLQDRTIGIHTEIERAESIRAKIGQIEELLSNGRYDLAKGEIRSAYQGIFEAGRLSSSRLKREYRNLGDNLSKIFKRAIELENQTK